jgi:hypothetical protein
MAAALQLGQYVPLEDLAADFWSYQHELAYLEGAALVAYLVETYGWESFLALYALRGLAAASQTEWLDLALQQQVGVPLDDAERGMLDWLSAFPPGDQVDDLRLTIALLDTMRRYQALYAPYQVGLPPISDAIETGLTAEFLRGPVDPENIALETMLSAAQAALHQGRYAEAETLILSVNATLDDGDFTRPPVADYLAIVQVLGELGYEVQRITFTGESAEAAAISDWPTVETFALARLDGAWQLTLR